MEPGVRPPAIRTPHASPALRRVTAAEYLAAESAAEWRSELIEGRIIEMAGASRTHVTIAGNIIRELKNQLDERPYITTLMSAWFAATIWWMPCTLTR